MSLAALPSRVPSSARLDRRTFLAVAVTGALAGCESLDRSTDATDAQAATDAPRKPRTGGVDGYGYGRAGFGEGSYGGTDSE
jgi:type IV pilus biogenesis protein CpaD/CtpE